MKLISTCFFILLLKNVSAQNKADSLLSMKQLSKQKVYTSLKAALKHPEKVYSLKLDGQALDSLPDTIGLLYNLQALSIGIGPKPSVSKRLLRKASKIGGGIYHLDRGTGTYVASNNLKSLPKAFSALTKLQYLNLGYNEFEELPVDFTVFKNLKVLNLVGCRGLVDNLEEINLLKEELPVGCTVIFIDEDHKVEYWWPF